ncbi:hypothetical protein PACTADRAFT_34107 [Pachysolen tannophilus NRRL Y-2460]|uniref:Uncharacterized protein n=1 Tax=Pachysolen tannophilus NRRL Y-2460 TaxID=669874 RepID=A0A1E4TUW9_PACTA|nr:hypothetical protein PACTADRAFT_34107 [Pachysolen tannophilus NRRL Y-2460]
MPARIPITSCLDSSQGSGGTVGVSFSVEIEIAANPTFSMASPILDLISLSTSFSVSKTFSLTSSYQCTVKKGKKGQLYASPIIVDAVFQKKALSQENDDSDWSAPFKVSVPVLCYKVYRRIM